MRWPLPRLPRWFGARQIGFALAAWLLRRLRAGFARIDGGVVGVMEGLKAAERWCEARAAGEVRTS